MMTAQRLRHAEVMAKMFAPGDFVMLGCQVFLADDTLHPDAGRVGKIVSESNGHLVVEFFVDELIGKMSACILPKPMWMPVPRFMVDEYFPSAKKRGWRITERGERIFDGFPWPRNDNTSGRPATSARNS